MPKLSVGGYTQVGTSINISTTGPHGLVAGNNVFVSFTSGSAVTGTYQVVNVPDPMHFTITAASSVNQNENSLAVFPLVPPPIPRSGTVIVQENTWNMSYTDTGTTSSLSQSPLRSPTVFNFFYPGFEFPGVLASAGLTTPEFQLTSASGVALPSTREQASRAVSRLRAAAMTCAPCFANTRSVSNPRPELLPVSSTVIPRRSIPSVTSSAVERRLNELRTIQ